MMPKLIDELSTEFSNLSREVLEAEQKSGSLKAEKEILEYIINNLHKTVPPQLELLSQKQCELAEVTHHYEKNQIVLEEKKQALAKVQAELIAEAQLTAQTVEILQNTVAELTRLLQQPAFDISNKATQLAIGVNDLFESTKTLERHIKEGEELESLLKKSPPSSPLVTFGKFTPNGQPKPVTQTDIPTPTQLELK